MSVLPYCQGGSLPAGVTADEDLDGDGAGRGHSRDAEVDLGNAYEAFDGACVENIERKISDRQRDWLCYARQRLGRGNSIGDDGIGEAGAGEKQRPQETSATSTTTRLRCRYCHRARGG